MAIDGAGAEGRLRVFHFITSAVGVDFYRGALRIETPVQPRVR